MYWKLRHLTPKTRLLAKTHDNELYVQPSRGDIVLELDILKPDVEENIEKVEQDQFLQQVNELKVEDSSF